MNAAKPLGRKAYGSIPHLPNSRLGPRDYSINEGQARILTEKARDRYDTITVSEKLDGSCSAVAKVNGSIIPLTRAGYVATTSEFEHYHHFAHWVREREHVFGALLDEGERVVGEWLGMAHGTIYNLTNTQPWRPFDLFLSNNERACTAEFEIRVELATLQPVMYLHYGGPISVDNALALLDRFGMPTAGGSQEGVVYRCERKGKVDFLAKFVRPEKVDGCYLPNEEREPLWLWRPVDGGRP